LRPAGLWVKGGYRPAAMLTAFGDLFGAAHGSGHPWVLALHGWRRDHRDFDKVFAGGSGAGQGPGAGDGDGDGAGPLDGIALDLPGFGATPQPPEVWGSAEYAAAVAPVLTSMPGPAVVLGHSFGGRVAVQLAASHPGHVRALVLTGAPLFRPASRAAKPRMRYRVARRLARTGLIGEARLEKARQRYGSADYRAAEGVMRGILVRALQEESDEGYLAPLHAIDCPVELVWGDDDTAAPVEIAERIDREVRSSHLTVCRGAGHLTPLTAPGELRAALLRHKP
jgi:pimeloyl-ACP methyl ester carboxylesterase